MGCTWTRTRAPLRKGQWSGTPSRAPRYKPIYRWDSAVPKTQQFLILLFLPYLDATI